MTKQDIDALARLLDGDPTLNGEASPDVRALAALAHGLESAAARPRSEFTAGLRARLIDQARAQASQPSLLGRLRMRVEDATARWRYSTRVAAATGAAALALSGGGTALASQHALPGDVLYPVKLALEDARLWFIRGDVARGEWYLAMVERRLEEAWAAAEDGKHDSAAQALQEADEALRAGAGELIRYAQEHADRAVLARLADFVSGQRAEVTQLASFLEGPAAEAAARLLIALDRVDARVAAITGGCSACPDDVTPQGDAFDFAAIPPAEEPFAPCPCPQPSTPPPPPQDHEQPPPPEEDSPPVGDDPPVTSDDPPADEPSILPTLPGPLEEPGNVVDEIITDILEALPTPTLPIDPSLGGVGDLVEDVTEILP